MLNRNTLIDICAGPSCRFFGPFLPIPIYGAYLYYFYDDVVECIGRHTVTKGYIFKRHVTKTLPILKYHVTLEILDGINIGYQAFCHALHLVLGPIDPVITHVDKWVTEGFGDIPKNTVSNPHAFVPVNQAEKYMRKQCYGDGNGCPMYIARKQEVSCQKP